MYNKIGRLMLFVSISFVLCMLALRFSTLRFGQVFPSAPPVNPVQEQRIAALEDRLHRVEQTSIELKAQNAKLLEQITALNDTLASAAQQAQATPPPPPVTAPAPSVASRPEPSSPPAQSGDEVVHKGDSMKKVRQVFGRPTSTEVAGPYETWCFGDIFHEVRFDNGVVSSWDNMPVEP